MLRRAGKCSWWRHYCWPRKVRLCITHFEIKYFSLYSGFMRRLFARWLRSAKWWNCSAVRRNWLMQSRLTELPAIHAGMFVLSVVTFSQHRKWSAASSKPVFSVRTLQPEMQICEGDLSNTRVAEVEAPPQAEVSCNREAAARPRDWSINAPCSRLPFNHYVVFWKVSNTFSWFIWFCCQSLKLIMAGFNQEKLFKL